MILASITSLVPVCLPFFQTKRLKLHDPRIRWSSKGRATTQKGDFAQQYNGSSIRTLRLASEQQAHSGGPGGFGSKSSQLSGRSPPASPVLAYAPPYQSNKTHSTLNNPTLLIRARAVTKYNRIIVTREHKEYYRNRQEDKQLGLSVRISAD